MREEQTINIRGGRILDETTDAKVGSLIFILRVV